MSKKTEQRTGCVNNIEIVRDFVRESFVYGLKDRSGHTEKGSRTYDINAQRMCDWFNDCLQTKTIKVRRKVKYLSLNCREYAVNPLYKMWKACSFTSNEVMLFFFIIDYLIDKSEPVGLSEIYDNFICFYRSNDYTRSAAQKWLQNKGCPSGIFVKSKDGKFSKYSLAPIVNIPNDDFLQFYSEIAPCGVIGSFILDKQEPKKSIFGYKQHYIGQAFDSEILCNVLYAIKYNREVYIKYLPKNGEEIKIEILPIKVLSSTQNGRQYLIGWDDISKKYYTYRIDYIKEVDICDITKANYNSLREEFKNIRNHLWGVSFGECELTHVEFMIKASEDEGYIVRRLIREKRCGTVNPVKNKLGIYRFEADVYDAQEMFPWIRTYIGRIIELYISNDRMEKMFWSSLDKMYEIYDLGE